MGLVDAGHASRVDYAGLQREKPLLDAYTASLSAVAPSEFRSWGRSEQEAFLINAYNAFTVELILTRYPNVHSIRGLGGWLSSPWKRRFFALLGEESSLADVENRLRMPAYDDPRIHFAINCASVGCPMLRQEAYVADRLDQQLNDALQRFLSDQSRNRYNAQRRVLEVSKIFDWYSGDFAAGHHGSSSVAQLLSEYADLLTSNVTDQARIRAGEIPVTFLPYDWSLNDLQR